MNVDSDKFAQELEKLLGTYTDEVTEIVKRDVDEVADETLKVLVENAPKKKGKYKKSLSKTKSYEGPTDKRYTLHAKSPEYRKTHLLENGHATRNGGRTKSVPHFSKANEYVDKNLMNRIKNDIEHLSKK